MAALRLPPPATRRANAPPCAHHHAGVPLGLMLMDRAYVRATHAGHPPCGGMGLRTDASCSTVILRSDFLLSPPANGGSSSTTEPGSDEHRRRGPASGPAGRPPARSRPRPCGPSGRPGGARAPGRPASARVTVAVDVEEVLRRARRRARPGPVAHGDRLTTPVSPTCVTHAGYPCSSPAEEEGPAMSALLLLTSALQPSAEVLPGLALLSHTVKILPAQGSALLDAPEADLLLVDGRQDLAAARDLCRLIRTTGADVPVLLVVTEGGLAVVAHDWGMDDVVLHTCGPAELEARIRLAIGRLAAPARGRRPRGPRDPPRRGRRSTRRPTPPSVGGRAARPDLQGVRAPQVPRPAPRPGLQPRAAARRRCGATTTSAAPAPSTSTYAACAPSSAPSTSTSSARSATSATASCCRPDKDARRAAQRRRGATRRRLTPVDDARVGAWTQVAEVIVADAARGGRRRRPLDEAARLALRRPARHASLVDATTASRSCTTAT